VLKVALPRPSSDAVNRGDGRGDSRMAWAEDEEVPFRRLTRAEADELNRRQPALSPWWVVLSQIGVGALVAATIGVLSGSVVAAQSALYGAAAVALPAAVMAHGATSPLSSISPLSSGVSMMAWALLKWTVAVLMLVLAPRIVPGLIWTAMLATLVVCMQTYGFALLWRKRPEVTA
jgi:ATP synthase protein I